MIKRVINEDTGLYFFDIGSELSSGNLTKGTRYLVTKKAETSSVIPTGLQVGDIFLCQKDRPGNPGRKVITGVLV